MKPASKQAGWLHALRTGLHFLGRVVWLLARGKGKWRAVGAGHWPPRAALECRPNSQLPIPALLLMAALWHLLRPTLPPAQVLFYLIRLEPFTGMNRALQAGSQLL